LFKKFSIEVAKDYYNIKLNETKNYEDFEKVKNESAYFELFTELKVPEMIKNLKKEEKNEIEKNFIVEIEKIDVNIKNENETVELNIENENEETTSKNGSTINNE
jgi:hypothetical protein